MVEPWDEVLDRRAAGVSGARLVVLVEEVASVVCGSDSLRKGKFGPTVLLLRGGERGVVDERGEVAVRGECGNSSSAFGGVVCGPICCWKP